MKFKSTLFATLFFTLCSGLLFGQSEMTLNSNAYINDQILGDTSDLGEQLHDVYLVERGKYYLLNGTMEVDFKLNIQGPDMGPMIHDKGTPMPPVITSLADSEGKYRRVITLVNDGEVVLKNLIMNGRDDYNNNAAYIVYNLSGKSVLLDNLAILNWDIGLRNRATGSDITVTNCLFANIMDETGYRWGGMPMRIDGQPASVIFENNTLLNCGRLFANSGPWLKCYFRYNHNTVINNNMGAVDLRADLLFSNNIFFNWSYDGWPDSEGDGEISDDPYRRYFTIENFPEGLPMDSVSCWWGRNAFYRQQSVVDFFDATDTLHMDEKFNPNVFTLVKNDDDFIISSDWDDEDPGFNELEDKSADFLQWLEESILGFEVVHDYSFDAPSVSWNGETVSWPHNFDLTYSNEKLMKGGEDGYPVGDLNWYPDKLAQWNADKDNIISALESHSDSTGLPTSISESVFNSEVASCYPNPFTTSLNIEYAVDQPAYVSIKVYDATGRTVNVLVSKYSPSGEFSVQWNGKNQNQQSAQMGLYIVKFDIGDKSFYQKVIRN